MPISRETLILATVFQYISQWQLHPLLMKLCVSYFCFASVIIIYLTLIFMPFYIQPVICKTIKERNHLKYVKNLLTFRAVNRKST